MSSEAKKILQFNPWARFRPFLTLSRGLGLSDHFNPLTTGKDHFWSPSFLTLWEIEIAVIFPKYEKLDGLKLEIR